MLFLCKKRLSVQLLTGFEDEVHILIFNIFFNAKLSTFKKNVLQNPKIQELQNSRGEPNFTKSLSYTCENVRFKAISRLLSCRYEFLTVIFARWFCKFWLARFNSISGCFWTLLADILKWFGNISLQDLI